MAGSGANASVPLGLINTKYKDIVTIDMQVFLINFGPSWIKHNDLLSRCFYSVYNNPIMGKD